MAILSSSGLILVFWFMMLNMEYQVFEPALHSSLDMVTVSVHGIGVPRLLPCQRNKVGVLSWYPTTPEALWVFPSVLICCGLMALLTLLSHQCSPCHCFYQQNPTVVCVGTSGGPLSVPWPMTSVFIIFLSGDEMEPSPQAPITWKSSQ
jgi:hypothetical protein